MLLDKKQSRWCLATLAAAAIATLSYVLYARTMPGGPRGGTWPGLAFGAAGTVLMVYCGLIWARKKYPACRIGSAQSWLRGHIWMGLLSVLLVLFHAGWRLGGPLEQALMAVFGLVVASGVYGLALQQILPRMLTARSQSTQGPLETFFDQVRHVCALLEEQGRKIAGELPADGQLAGVQQQCMETVGRYLAPDASRRSPLANPVTSAETFAAWRTRLPRAVHDRLRELEKLCEERRALATQVRIHHWLHGWLLVHVPLTLALLVLGVVHIVASLYY